MVHHGLKWVCYCKIFAHSFKVWLIKKIGTEQNKMLIFVDFFVLLAHIYSNKVKNFEEAKKCFENACRLLPDEPLAHANYAVLLKNRFQDHSKASKHYEKAIKLKPTAWVWTNYGLCLAAQKRY